MQRDFWPFQYEEQFLLVVVEAFQGEVEELIVGFLGEDVIECGGESIFFLFRRLRFVGFQFIVEIPDLLSNLFQGLSSEFIRGDELVDGPFGVNPAERVEKDIELTGIVTDDDKALGQAMSEHGADQGTLGCDTDMAVMNDAQIVQVALPLFIIQEVLFRGFSDLSEQRFGKVVRIHVCKGVVIDLVVVMTGSQQLEEIDSTLAVRAFKPGEQVVAHVGAVAVFPVMTSAGIVHVDERGDLEAHGEDFILFLMEAILVLGKNRAELTRGNLDPPFLQLFEQEGLCDMTLIVLIQDEALQGWREMALDLRWQLAHDVASIRSLPTFEEVADIVRFDLDALNGKGLKVFEQGSFGDVLGRAANLFVDLQLFGLLALLVFAFLFRRFLAFLLLFVLLKLTGPDLRFRLLPFQPGNLITELLDDLRLCLN